MTPGSIEIVIKKRHSEKWLIGMASYYEHAAYVTKKKQDPACIFSGVEHEVRPWPTLADLTGVSLHAQNIRDVILEMYVPCRVGGAYEACM
jgi:hypothetical protein